MIYIFTIGFIFITSLATLALCGGSVGGTIDIPSMFVILASLFTVLIASNSVRDFFRSLKIASSKKDFSALHIAQSLTAVSLVIQSLLCAAGMILCLCIAMLLSLSDDKSSFGPVIALALLTIFYTGEILLVLLPVKSVLYKKLSAFKKTPSQKSFVFSKIPCKPIVAFAVGIVVLFFLLTLGHTFVLSDYVDGLLSSVPAMILFFLLSSYLFLLAAKLFFPYISALKNGISTHSSENIQNLSEAKRAVNFVILVRFTLSACAAVLLTVCTLNSLSDKSLLPFRFGIPLIFLALSFLSALFLLPVRARIEKAVNFRVYGES